MVIGISVAIQLPKLKRTYSKLLLAQTRKTQEIKNQGYCLQDGKGCSYVFPFHLSVRQLRKGQVESVNIDGTNNVINGKDTRNNDHIS